MKLIDILLIMVVFFIGLIILVAVCAKYNYELCYKSNKDKKEIKIAPAQGDKTKPTKR
jgi:hypothetical protein